MLKLLRKKEYNIGIDMGGASLKMMQLGKGSNGPEVVAAAKVEVPVEVRSNRTELQKWYIHNIREQLSRMSFKGKKVVSTMPNRDLIIQHLRIAKMDNDQLDKALAFEAQGKVPFDTSTAMIRYVVAGEIYENNEPKLEVIFMAAPLQAVRQHLYVLEKARMEVEGLQTEPNTTIKCFAHLLAAQEPNDKAIMFVDLAHDSTNVVIAHGIKMAFSRNIGIAAADIHKEIMNKTGVDYYKAVQLHYEYRHLRNISITGNEDIAVKSSAYPNNAIVKTVTDATSGNTEETQTNGTALLTKTTENNDRQTPEIQAQAIVEKKLERLATEIRNCVRYHNLTFETQPVGKVIFLGGQTKNKRLCQYLAQLLQLPAQIGDPLARIINIEKNIDKHNLLSGHNSSEWAVAFGLSLK